MIRYRTLYSSYPQVLWKRLPILRNLRIEAREDLMCSILEQHVKPRRNGRLPKSIRFVFLLFVNCALMKESFLNVLPRVLTNPTRWTRLTDVQTLHKISLEKNMSEHIKNVSDGSFTADVLNSSQPVLVDYWAAWCGPCKQIAPMLEEVATEYAGKVTVAKLNVDENQETAAKFGIRGIPTLMLFKNGEVAATKVGALSKAQLTEFLNSAI